jgi:hypothetical protein
MLFELFTYEINDKKKTVWAVSSCCSIGSVMKDVHVSTDEVLNTYLPYLIF